jgi:hypothetical protein
MAYIFQPQSCRFMLFSPFTEIITDQLQNLPFDPVNGIRLSFQSCTSDCRQSVNIEIDSEGNLSKLSVIDTETNSADMIFDFSGNEFIHHNESLDLTCANPLFQMLQQTFPAHYQAGHYAVIVTAH